MHMEPFYSLDLDMDAFDADQVGISCIATVLLGSAGFEPEEPV